MEFTVRQKKIIEIVKENEPISGDRIAKQLNLTRPTLRSDLAILTMTGILDARPKVGYFYSGQSIEPLLFEKLYEKKVSEIMSTPIFINADMTIQDAVTQMFMYDTGTLFVMEENQLVGIMSRKDLLRATVHAKNIDEMPVAVMMTRMPNIITILPDDRILDAGYQLMKHEVDSLPVIAGKNDTKVIGKVSKTSLVNYFIKEGLRIQNRE